MKKKWLSVIMVVALVASSSLALNLAGIDIPYENVAKGKDYYYNTVEPSGGYADEDMVKITDGLYSWSWGNMAGFNSSEEFAEIEIDLGKKQKIVGVSVLNMLSMCSGVRLPEGYTVEISLDGNKFEKIADLTCYPEEEEDETYHHWFAEFAEVEARYVRVNVELVSGVWVMIPEIFVWAK